jgi:hypothetical protein
MSMTSTIGIALGAGLLLVAGCITPDGYYRNLDGGGQGGSGTGGTVTGTGGATPGTGGTATGGTTGTGGTVVATGGTTGVAGTSGKGGTTATGGTTGTGGLAATGGTAGSGSVLFSDNFENGLGNWIANGPGTDMTATDATSTDGSTVYDLACPMSKAFLSAAGNVSWTDVVFQAKVKIVSFNGSSSSYYAGICARVADANNYYCVTLRSDTKVAIRGDVGGSSNSIGNSNSYGVATGVWYTVVLEVVGGTITASINGTPVLPKPGDPPITDSSITHGGIAVIVDNAEAEFDGVSVTTP